MASYRFGRQRSSSDPLEEPSLHQWQRSSDGACGLASSSEAWASRQLNSSATREWYLPNVHSLRTVAGDLPQAELGLSSSGSAIFAGNVLCQCSTFPLERTACWARFLRKAMQGVDQTVRRLSVEDELPAALAFYQPGRLEDRQMLGDGCLRHGEPRSDIASVELGMREVG